MAALPPTELAAIADVLNEIASVLEADIEGRADGSATSARSERG